MSTPTVALTTDHLQNAASQLRNGKMDTSLVSQNQNPFPTMNQDGNISPQLAQMTGQFGDAAQQNPATGGAGGGAAKAGGGGCGGGGAAAGGGGANQGQKKTVENAATNNNANKDATQPPQPTTQAPQPTTELA